MNLRGGSASVRGTSAILLMVIAASCGDAGLPVVQRATPTAGVAASTVRFVPGHMAFADPLHGWVDGAECTDAAVGAACLPQMMATDDGGRSWRRTVSPPLILNPACLAAGCASAPAHLLFPTPSLGLAYGGTVPYLYITTDGALSWHAVARGGAPADVVAGPVSDIATVSGGELWMVMRSCTLMTAVTCPYVVLTSLDGGSSWKTVPSQPDSVVDLRSTVQLVSRQSTVWLMSAAGPRPDTRIATTHDAGRTWTNLSNPCPQDNRYLELLDAVDARTLWMVCGGVRSPGPGPVYVSSTAGARWSQVTADPHVMTGARRLVISSATTAWLSIIRAPLQVTRDGGHSWSTAIPDSAVDEVVFTDSDHGWAMEGAERGSAVRLWHTVDAGSSWTQVTF